MSYNTYLKKTRIQVTAARAFAWHAREGAIHRLTPPWAPMKMVYRNQPGIQAGTRVWFKIRMLGISMLWKAHHTEYVENHHFKDCQEAGPFSLWEHTHRFPEDGQSAFFMEDHIRFKLPFGILSRPFYRYAQKEFGRMFSYRHRVLKQDLENNPEPVRPKRILVSGAGGTIGSSLIPFLQTQGHEVIQLVRDKKLAGDSKLYWDPYAGILDLESIGHIDAVINLNGADISRGRWTPDRRKVILDSRIVPTRLLVEKMSMLKNPPEVFLSSSAIGFYGSRGDLLLDESHGTGDCFISEVCSKWEQASQGAEGSGSQSGIRTVQLRIGIVLTPAGGALARMAPAFRTGCGVRLADAGQYMSWISMDDALAAIYHIISHTGIRGPVNLTAPHPVTNRFFSDTLAKVFSRKVISTMPAWLVGLLWGQMGEETLLASARVLPLKLLKSGFSFQHKTLAHAFRDLLGK